MENRCLLRSVKGSLGVYLYILGVLPALRLCVVLPVFR
nr:MAG TPA: hypothetical protein [Caudoviricetes sp.]